MASAWEQRFAEFVRRIVGLRESTALEVLPDLMPVLDVFSDLPELALSRGERPFSLSVVRSAAAGNFPTLNVNCQTPNALLVLDGMLVSTGTGQQVIAELTTVATLGAYTEVATSSKEYRDRRIKFSNEEPVARGGYLDTAVAIAADELFAMQLGASAPVILPIAVMLTEGTALRVQGQTLATALQLTVWGRERALTRDELFP